MTDKLEEIEEKLGSGEWFQNRTKKGWSKARERDIRWLIEEVKRTRRSLYWMTQCFDYVAENRDDTAYIKAKTDAGLEFRINFPDANEEETIAAQKAWEEAWLVTA